jgi:uncharacterized protein YkwD
MLRNISPWGKPVAACVLLLAALLLPARWGGAEEDSAAQAVPEQAQADGPWIESYMNDAEVEALYGSAADEITQAQAGALLLELTNQARAEAGLSQLGWRADAAQVGQAHSDEMVAQHYINHYDLAGRKCELRYNADGGTDQVSENTAYYEIHAEVYLTPQLVKRMHQHWLDSEGHRLNIMEAAHTHAGAGFTVAREDGLSYIVGTVEFLNDYGDYQRLPERARPGQALKLTGQLDDKRARLAFIGIGSEDLPTPRTVEYQMSHIGGYSPPLPVMFLLPAADALAQTPEAWRYVRPTVQFDQASGKFTADIILRANWPAAAYYMSAWAVPPGALKRNGTPDYSRAFCVMTQVVLVEQPSAFH